MEDIGRLLRKADFSKETDLKSRLAGQLFDAQHTGKEIPFTRLSPEELMQVSAARGIPDSRLPQELQEDIDEIIKDMKK